MSISGTFKQGFYLVFSEWKGRGAKWLDVRVAERNPTLKPGEVSMYVTLEVPRALFQRPQLSAEIKIPANAALPPVVNAEVVGDLAKQLSEATGFDITLKVQE